MGRLVYVISFCGIGYFTGASVLLFCLGIAGVGEATSVVHHYAQLLAVTVAGLYVFGVHKLCWWIKGGFEKNEK